MIDDRFGSPPTDAPFPWRAIVFVLAAALLVVWATGPKGRLASDPGALSTICKSFGKGGEFCASEAAADKQAPASPARRRSPNNPGPVREVGGRPRRAAQPIAQTKAPASATKTRMSVVSATVSFFVAGLCPICPAAASPK